MQMESCNPHQHYVVACSALVRDLKDQTIQCEHCSFSKAIKAAADRVYAIVVDDREACANRWREADRDVQRGAARAVEGSGNGGEAEVDHVDHVAAIEEERSREGQVGAAGQCDIRAHCDPIAQRSSAAFRLYGAAVEKQWPRTRGAVTSRHE